jgi:hypothetical protein
LDFVSSKLKRCFGFNHGGISYSTIGDYIHIISECSKCDFTRSPKGWFVLGCLSSTCSYKGVKSQSYAGFEG